MEISDEDITSQQLKLKEVRSWVDHVIEKVPRYQSTVAEIITSAILYGDRDIK